ncbi:undecaprenyldiphospho-muramoylpentapeptide beta-N-acetylglucosaminyltransferase [Robiginitalea sp. M366]|uniref:undecaprenyldiphospho-muramoylpentapeptide beta-N-acetylglucosaminyltransferase n=1 Tax=Robiginitalea aestuariiviva TaxID=3036903 RepID=UPI00240E9683|nr:undecaprenyldiphospho-muramoylpentapeptide beta-N-acetylglucosaminyltransferase [Robiginitalea aestuariiviva]MDG1570858.1 undecaprenyldiphospho-muramoylpentapeptide beta-N-acetylglucosaminyltransferase [Robiginitalea aestuariiviva]
MDNYRFLLSGGGTGGHIYPAIAIAEELKRRYPGAEILFVGARGRMEMEKVPQAGYPIRGLWISGLVRKLTWKNLLFPIKVLVSLMQAWKIIRSFKPHLVVGTGGFASGPTLRMASAMGIPYVLQEQNSYAGITNKWLAGKARRIFVAYDGMERFFPARALVFTGNPVRERLARELPPRSQSLTHFGLQPGRTTLLVLGGSLGARRINQLVDAHLPLFKKMGLQVLWQCGKGYYETYQDRQAEGVAVRAFISEMDAAYASADMIISRAGAGSVSELCLIGKPVLFIPSPNVAEDHQTKNAQAMVSAGAALMMKESELDTGFEGRFRAWVEDPQGMLRMGARMQELGRPAATRHIGAEIQKIVEADAA